MLLMAVSLQQLLRQCPCVPLVLTMIKAFWRNLGYHSLQEAAHLRDELAREYDMRAQAAVREKQQLDL